MLIYWLYGELLVYSLVVVVSRRRLEQTIFGVRKGVNMRSCIFCGDSKLTSEDAWPLWLMRLFPKNIVGTMEAQRGKNEPQTWLQKSPSVKVKYVCECCNNGWMSQLEGKVKPVVKALLGPKSAFIDSQQQATLGVWSVKNAMVFEALRHDQPWFYLSTERKTLKETLQPPVKTFVWIAKCVNHDGPYCEGSDITGIADESTIPINCYLTTMAFKALAIQVLSFRLQQSIVQYSQVISRLRPGPWDQATLCIWPTKQAQISWPPSFGLCGEAGLQAFRERWKSSLAA
jgi:hypothetical protein